MYFTFTPVCCFRALPPVWWAQHLCVPLTPPCLRLHVMCLDVWPHSGCPGPRGDVQHREPAICWRPPCVWPGYGGGYKRAGGGRCQSVAPATCQRHRPAHRSLPPSILHVRCAYPGWAPCMRVAPWRACILADSSAPMKQCNCRSAAQGPLGHFQLCHLPCPPPIPRARSWPTNAPLPVFQAQAADSIRHASRVPRGASGDDAGRASNGAAPPQAAPGAGPGPFASPRLRPQL
jgi:hypothetical protein